MWFLIFEDKGKILSKAIWGKSSFKTKGVILENLGATTESFNDVYLCLKDQK
jgi:hypothetical protein